MEERPDATGTIKRSREFMAVNSCTPRVCRVAYDRSVREARREVPHIAEEGDGREMSTVDSQGGG
jgi:hypothetical protein